MLFYERKLKIKNPFPEKRLAVEDSPIHSQMMKEITKMNMFQKVQNILFSEEYLRFVSQLVQDAKQNSKESTKILKFSALVYLTVVMREKN